jgi:hypothetical protein
MTLAEVIKKRINKIKLPEWGESEFIQLYFPFEGVLPVVNKMKNGYLEKPVCLWDYEKENRWIPYISS